MKHLGGSEPHIIECGRAFHLSVHTDGVAAKGSTRFTSGAGTQWLRFIQSDTALREKRYALGCEPIGRGQLILHKLRVTLADKNLQVRLHRISQRPRVIADITE